MTDLELTRLCAEAMGLVESGEAYDGHAIWVDPPRSAYVYSPLTKNGQAMELIKQFDLLIHPFEPPIADKGTWFVSGDMSGIIGESKDLNRAIVECVAKMQKARTISAHPSPETPNSV